MTDIKVEEVQRERKRKTAKIKEDRNSWIERDRQSRIKKEKELEKQKSRRKKKDQENEIKKGKKILGEEGMKENKWRTQLLVRIKEGELI